MAYKAAAFDRPQIAQRPQKMHLTRRGNSPTHVPRIRKGLFGQRVTCGRIHDGDRARATIDPNAANGIFSTSGGVQS
jgi:hypothetical protein